MGPVRVQLENVDDMAYTAKVWVSREAVHPIMDTGSFELVLFEHGCQGCQADKTFFDRNKAGKDFKPIGFDAEQGYGSGTAISAAVRARVSMNDMQGGGQPFWLAHDLNMDLPVDDSFAGIFGLGPPASALAFAVEELDAAKQEVGQLSKPQQAQYQKLLHSMQLVVNLEKDQKPWLNHVKITQFSVCLRPGAGSGGVVVLNDEAPGSGNWVEVAGKYWQVDVAEASIGGNTAGNCSAIVDSGTSLIGVPFHFLNMIEDMVNDLSQKFGCQDLSKWPQFNIVLKGGQTLSLDPSSYVAEYDGSSWGDQFSESDVRSRAKMERVMKYMPHLNRFRPRRSHGETQPSQTFCAPALFNMDIGVDADSSCQFLVGLPVFRSYVISHKMTDNGLGHSMMFTEGGNSCSPWNNSQTMTEERWSFPMPLKVDPRKIRFPSIQSRRKSQARWAHRVGRV